MKNNSAKTAFMVEVGNLNKEFSKWRKIENFVVHAHPLGFLMTTNNFFIKNIEKYLERLVSAGIIDYYIRNFTSWTFKTVAERKLPFLTLNDFRFGFLLFSCCIAACFITFCVEILIFKFLKKKVNILCDTRQELRNRHNNGQDQHLEEVQKEITKLVGFIIHNVDVNV